MDQFLSAIFAGAASGSIYALVAIGLVLVWRGAGVHGPEVFDAKPFLDLMSSSVGYNLKWEAQERLPASPLRHP